MPDPAILAHREWLNHRIDTTDNYRAEYFYLHCEKSSYIGNKIMYPPGHSTCGQKANADRRKSETGFFAVFFCAFLEKSICSCLALLRSKERDNRCQEEKSKSNQVKKWSGWRLRKRNIRTITAHGGSRRRRSRGTGRLWRRRDIGRNLTRQGAMEWLMTGEFQILMQGVWNNWWKRKCC